MTMKRTWTFALPAATKTVTLATSGSVADKGKPRTDPPPEPEPPPVTHAFQRFFMPADYSGWRVALADTARLKDCRHGRMASRDCLAPLSVPVEFRTVQQSL